MPHERHRTRIPHRIDRNRWRLLGNPRLLVSFVPSDAGMIAMMALIYLVLPVTAIALGLLAANSARTLFWVPAALGIGPAVPFPLKVEGSQDLAFHGVAYTAIGYAAMGLYTWMTARQHR